MLLSPKWAHLCKAWSSRGKHKDEEVRLKLTFRDGSTSESNIAYNACEINLPHLHSIPEVVFSAYVGTGQTEAD